VPEIQEDENKEEGSIVEILLEENESPSVQEPSIDEANYEKDEISVAKSDSVENSQQDEQHES
jgi:hypothetical protein